MRGRDIGGKVINAGSGRNMVNINEWDTKGMTIVGVNNVWKGTRKLNHLICAGDYPETDEIRLAGGAMLHSYDRGWSYINSYMNQAKMEWKDARIYLGLPMYFGSAHWTLHYLKPDYLGFIGFDMNYTPTDDGSTAFYGVGYDIQTRGIPDPMYQFQRVYKNDPDILQKLFERLDERRGKTKLFNLSDDPDSLLPWEKISFEEFKEL